MAGYDYVVSFVLPPVSWSICDTILKILQISTLCITCFCGTVCFSPLHLQCICVGYYVYYTQKYSFTHVED